MDKADLHVSRMIDNDYPNNIIKFSLYEYPGAEESFPIDEYGQHLVTFCKKKYKFGSHILRCSEYFKNHFKNNTKDELILTLKYSTSETAFNQVMKLLYGFKEVLIPESELIQFFVIINELGVNDKSNFRERVEDIILSYITSTNVFDALEAGINLQNVKLRERCEEYLIQNSFKDILFHRNKVLKLQESTFIKLMELNSEAKTKAKSKCNEYISSTDIREICKEYCEVNYASNPDIKESKLNMFLKMFLIIRPNEPSELYQSIYRYTCNPDNVNEFSPINQENFLKNQLDMVHYHMLKLDKQNEEIKKDNKILKESIYMIKTTVNDAQTNISSTLNENLQAITEQLKKIAQATVEGLKETKRRDDIIYNNFISLSHRIDVLSECGNNISYGNSSTQIELSSSSASSKSNSQPLYQTSYSNVNTPQYAAGTGQQQQQYQGNTHSPMKKMPTTSYTSYTFDLPYGKKNQMI